ncbi:MAG TPA: hypothetical protein VLA84_01055 [Microcoleus sp.]|nr:hypothetical protein [Microcoleus sp.]
MYLREHLTFSAKLEIGVLRPEAAGQEAGGKRKKERGRRKEEEVRSQNQYYYKYEMLPVFNDSSINEGGYLVSRILAGESDCIEKITSALLKSASILREIDKVRTTSGSRSNQVQLGFVILSSDYLEPYKSQLPKSHTSLTQNSGLGVRMAVLTVSVSRHKPINF